MRRSGFGRVLIVDSGTAVPHAISSWNLWEQQGLITPDNNLYSRVYIHPRNKRSDVETGTQLASMEHFGWGPEYRGQTGYRALIMIDSSCMKLLLIRIIQIWYAFYRWWQRTPVPYPLQVLNVTSKSVFPSIYIMAAWLISMIGLSMSVNMMQRGERSSNKPQPHKHCILVYLYQTQAISPPPVNHVLHQHDIPLKNATGKIRE